MSVTKLVVVSIVGPVVAALVAAWLAWNAVEVLVGRDLRAAREDAA